MLQIINGKQRRLTIGAEGVDLSVGIFSATTGTL